MESFVSIATPIIIIIFAIYTHFRLQKLSAVTTTINDFISTEADQPELSEEELNLQQTEQLLTLQPLVDMLSTQILEGVKVLINNKAMTKPANLAKMQNSIDKQLVEDVIANHEQGHLIQLAIDNGWISKGIMKMVGKNPGYIDILLQRFGPKLAELEAQLLGVIGVTENKPGIPANHNSGYTGNI